MKITRFILLSVAALFMVAPVVAKKAKKQQEVKRPVVCIWNFDKMVAARDDIRNNPSSPYRPAYKSLVAQAEKLLTEKTTSVMDKAPDRLIKVDDPHAFVAASKYYHFVDGKWIHDENRPINKDEYLKYDVQNMERMTRSTSTLGLAYFFTGDERYAKKAVQFAYDWCVNPDTYMTPHFNYAQAVPDKYGKGVVRGHAAGVIFGYTLVNMVAGISLVQDSKAYTPEFHEGLSKWIEDMYNWMDTSAFGRKESMAKGNHACAYDESMLAYALFLGKKDAAERIVAAYPEKRIFAQIEPSGEMPQETRRVGRGLSYSWYNIMHLLTMCDMALEINPKLYWSESKDGRSISAALRYLLPYLEGDESSWPKKQFDWASTQATGAWYLLRAVSFEPDAPYMDVFNKVKERYPNKIRVSNIRYITR